VGQTLGRVGLGAGWLGFEVVRPDPWLPRIITRNRSLSWWKKPVKAALLGQQVTWLGRPTTTWRQTDPSKLMEVPFTPINILILVTNICCNPHEGSFLTYINKQLICQGHNDGCTIPIASNNITT
jgi:hypothetical protein